MTKDSQLKKFREKLFKHLPTDGNNESLKDLQVLIFNYQHLIFTEKYDIVTVDMFDTLTNYFISHTTLMSSTIIRARKLMNLHTFYT